MDEVAFELSFEGYISFKQVELGKDSPVEETT